MKKLMFAVAAVAMSMVASASSWNWNNGSSVLKDVNGDIMSGATVYLMQSSSATAANDYTDLIAILGDLRSGATTVNAVTANAIKTGTTDSAGKMGDYVGFNLETAANAFYYELVVDGDNIYFSPIAKVAASTNPDVAKNFSLSFGASTQIKGDADFSTPGWYNVAAVPEPTSGLLLLLGVAGLALRRRRA